MYNNYFALNIKQKEHTIKISTKIENKKIRENSGYKILEYERKCNRIYK